jgi:hypothetical protein
MPFRNALKATSTIWDGASAVWIGARVVRTHGAGLTIAYARCKLESLWQKCVARPREAAQRPCL